MNHKHLGLGAGLVAMTLIIVGSLFHQTLAADGARSFFGSEFSAKKVATRKSFAKGLAAYLKLPKEKSAKCFQDVNVKDASTPAVCALQKAKILQGTAKQKLQPKSPLTWGFALETVCRAKNWVKTPNWKSCLTFAQKNGFAGDDVKSGKKITYAQLAVFFDGLDGTSGDTSAKTSAKAPSKKTVVSNARPVAEKNIEKEFFANLLLTATLPNRFYVDEVYYVEGKVVGSTGNEVFAFLCPEEEGCDQSVDFLTQTTDGKFRIPLHFSTPGNFQLGMIVGRSGDSRVETISVLPEPEKINAEGTAATILSVQYQKGETKFSWDGQGDLTRLTVFQGNRRKDYLFRQDVTSYAPEAKDFVGFQKGAAKWTVTQDSAPSATQNIDLTVQDFRKIENDSVQIIQLSETFSGPVHFIMKGRALKSISKKAAITLPNGKVEEFDFTSQDLAANTDFTVEKDLKETGTYIFELNNPQGSAVINIPLYVGTKIPLVPDYFALAETKLDKTPIENLDLMRQTLLGLINDDRAAHGVAKVTLSEDINKIAQGHSENMVTKNFFAHVDPQGRSPEQRRKDAKYMAGIRENLGKGGDLESVEKGLMRSPIHRIAIIDADMTRIGLGIAKNSEGYLLVTENFSADPMTTSSLSSIETELLTAANAKRTANGLSALNHAPTLREAATDWSTRMSQQRFFASTDPQGNTLLSSFRDHGIRSSLQANIVQASDKKQLKEQLLEQEGLVNSSNASIGIGLALNEVGDLFLTVVYTP